MCQGADGQRAQIARFIANGLFATAAHYSVLVCAIELLGVRPAGLANLLAAIAGITVSFIGNRQLVFRSHRKSVYTQGVRFLSLYAALALLHGGFLAVWTDLAGFDYRVGFLIATACQTALSYLGNQRVVFR